MKRILFVLILLSQFFSPRLFAENTGFYIGAGPAGMFQFAGEHRHYDPGPGFQMNLGYDWDKIGFRATFIVTSHDEEIPFRARDTSVEMIATSLGAKLYPLAFADKKDFPLQPYAVGGVGIYFLSDGSQGFDDDGATGFAGTFGYGVDWYIFESLSIGIEQDFHFVSFVEDENRNNGLFDTLNASDLYFISLSGLVTFHF